MSLSIYNSASTYVYSLIPNTKKLNVKSKYSQL